MRYRLLPFLYTTLEEAHRTGVPMFRPLLLNYQSDYNTLNMDDEFMIGADLLAAPILHPGESGRSVYLPAGTWFDFWTGKRIEGGTTIQVEAPLETSPLFVRGGAMIPMGPEMNYVGEKTGSLTYSIYPDAQGKATVSLYEDDGISQAFTQGVERRTTVTYDHGVIEVGAASGSYQPAARLLIFTIHGEPTANQATLDGQALASISEGGSGAGWWKSGGQISIQLPDDGRTHRIETH
jgi:alpha-glucosidase